jgi:hypothetical protein
MGNLRNVPIWPTQNLVRQEDQGTVAPQGTLLARPMSLIPGKIISTADSPSYKAPGHVPVEELAIFETSRLVVE